MALQWVVAYAAREQTLQTHACAWPCITMNGPTETTTKRKASHKQTYQSKCCGLRMWIADVAQLNDGSLRKHKTVNTINSSRSTKHFMEIKHTRKSDVPCQDSWLLLQGWNPRQKGYQITRVWLRWPSGKFPNDYENTTNTRVVKNRCSIFHDNTWWVARDRKVFAYTHNCMRAHIYICVWEIHNQFINHRRNRQYLHLSVVVNTTAWRVWWNSQRTYAALHAFTSSSITEEIDNIYTCQLL